MCVCELGAEQMRRCLLLRALCHSFLFSQVGNARWNILSLIWGFISSTPPPDCATVSWGWGWGVEGGVGAHFSTPGTESQEGATLRDARGDLWLVVGPEQRILKTSSPQRQLCHSWALLPISLQHHHRPLPFFSYKSQWPLLLQSPLRERGRRGWADSQDPHALARCHLTLNKGRVAGVTKLQPTGRHTLYECAIVRVKIQGIWFGWTVILVSKVQPWLIKRQSHDMRANKHLTMV